MPTLPFESNIANAINFVIFDIVLISLVFYLTSDVSGRLNDADLRAGEPRRLFLTSPPVIGGGVCSTRPLIAAFLLFARVIGLFLILVTNLNIGGKSEPVLTRQRAELVVPGSLSNFTSEDTEISMIRRAGCFSATSAEISAANGEEKIVYYGQIREESCEVDKELVFQDAVKFSQQVKSYNLTTGLCSRNELRERLGERATFYYCEYARIACFMAFDFPNEVLLDNCFGMLHNNGTTYLCDEGTVRPDMPFEGTDARIITGIDWKDDRWFESIFGIPGVTMEDYVHAFYGASVANRSVLVRSEKSMTKISTFWFVALAVKVVLVVALGVTSFGLWKCGFHTVAHDEQRIAQLLQRRVEESYPVLTGHRDTSLAIYLNASSSNGRLQVVASGGPAAAAKATQPEGVDQTDSNYQIHLEEAQHY